MRRSPPTSAPPRGLTLIELLVGLLIVAGLFALVVPAMESVLGVRVKEEAGRLAGAIRMIYDEAAMRGQTCRLVFVMPESVEHNGSYRIECTLDAARISPEIQDVDEGALVQEDEDPFADDSYVREEEELERRVKARAAWQAFAGRELQDRTLPPGVRLAGFWTPQLRDVVTVGEAYLYFLPLGETQAAYIWIQDSRENFYTLTVQPLTGRVKVFAENLEVPDV
ncbi:MAG: prepilin-type N-terminal cleavage/methylation domain-containing protein [Deltaproteobacteria bacterium]|nr:prepilin-type N-terminal cleavage/methylation domain-containing protein [Deltaproteobacteria bacterium]